MKFVAGAHRIARRAQTRISERTRGVGRSLIHLAAGRAADMAFADTRKLPAVVNTTQLQNSDGQMLFLGGYSQPGGTDIGS
jgi:hypothetical protein